MTDKPEPPIDAYVIALDETKHYNIDEADAPHIERIVGVYLLDRNVVTRLAEITPSYHLVHLYDEVWFKGDAEITDEDRERICEAYEMLGGDDQYVHCHDLNARLDAARDHGKQQFAYHAGETGVSLEDSDRDEQMEGLREYYCGNHVL